MERTNFEKLRVYKLAETLADGIWGVSHNLGLPREGYSWQADDKSSRQHRR
jgi:hypothetical protein